MDEKIQRMRCLNLADWGICQEEAEAVIAEAYRLDALKSQSFDDYPEPPLMDHEKTIPLSPDELAARLEAVFRENMEWEND